ncbi:hypothetical protein IFM89_002536 [Coptis chinensis]|uniref:Uncharacterized protein n=1 Tax=Coptis chinensis TaxID=261450 RepID=A0A835HL69_9MAGN|nr:hypothetical protein IFM89_002536 [Coptis chinensis]
MGGTGWRRAFCTSIPRDSSSDHQTSFSDKQSPNSSSSGVGMKNLTFVFDHTSHPWSRSKVLVWMNHELHLSYDFHGYMLLRSLEDEFRDIVGISVPLWVYAILCIFLDFQGTNMCFWLSFTPAIVHCTKLHRIVIKLALQVMDANPHAENQFNLRDDLFWFGKPKFLLYLIQLISFQNAFEMATFIWSYRCFLVLVLHHISALCYRYTDGIKVQEICGCRKCERIASWMGKRAGKTRHGRSYYYLDNATSVTSLDCSPISSWRFEDGSISHQPVSISVNDSGEQESRDENSYGPHTSAPLYDSYSDDDESEKD